MSDEILDCMLAMQQKGDAFAVATVVETRGSVSAKTSSKAVIDQYGAIVTGWIGGGCAESAVVHEALECMSTNRSSIIDIDLDDEVLGVGMPCGGHMRVYIEPILNKPALWIMGHGRVAECICRFADILGFRIIVNDPGAEAEKFPAAGKLINDDPEYEQLQPREQDYVVIATQHKGDHESMTRSLKSSAGYIALIASRKRTGLVLDYLKEKHFSEADIARVSAPCGLDLCAQTAEEIALSVVSEIVMLRRGGSGLRMQEKMANDKTSSPGSV